MSDYSHTVRGFVEAYLAVRKARNRFRFPDDDESEHKWDPLTDEEMDMALTLLADDMQNSRPNYVVERRTPIFRC